MSETESTVNPNLPAVIEPPTDKERERERKRILRQLQTQYNLPWEEARNLIRSEAPLMKVAVELAVKAAREFGLPLQGINIIPSKAGPGIYVNSDGVRWRLHTDRRGIKGSRGVVVHWPTKEEPYVVVQAFIEMGDGSVFDNYGAVDCQPGPGMSNAVMRATTKAKRRAGVDSVGIALPIFEDYQEELQDKTGGIAVKKSGVIEGEFTDITEPGNLGELLKWIGQQKKPDGAVRTADEAIAIVGDYSAIAGDVPGALKKLKDAWGIK